MRLVVESMAGEYRRYKALAESAIAQVDEDQLTKAAVGGNSIATLVWHISGNLQSRFTDFLTSDGEKPWRNRDDEFAQRTVSRADLLRKWETGWAVLTHALAQLDDEQLPARVTIRGVELSVSDALQRSLAHASYHVGQIVLLAKGSRGSTWRYLSIAPGGSALYNQNPVAEKPPGTSR